MASTTFVDQVTTIEADWLNDVDAIVYDIFNSLSAAGSDGTILVSDGSTYVEESGGTARTSLGVAIGSDVQAHGDVLDDLNTLGAASSDGEMIVATGAGAFAYESGSTLRTSIGTPTGTSGNVLGFLDGNNTHSGNNTFSGTATLSRATPLQDWLETDGTSTHNRTRIQVASDVFGITTRTDGNSFAGFDYTITKGSSGATQHDWYVGGSVAARIDSNSNLLIGTTTAATGNPKLDINGSITVSNSVSDATNKFHVISGRHYTNAEERMSLLVGRSSSSINSISYGGSLSDRNTVEQHSFFTAANQTTVTGTEQIRFAHTANNILQDTKIGGSAGDTPSARLHVVETASTQPVTLTLTTQDVGFIDFEANADADATSAISTHTTSGSVQGHIQIEVNGVSRWLAFYDDPSS